ncbi:MAG TPA: PDDEXK nuclease domain-containing protein [Verrucomicrobiae bacterium]|jgi:predicted nuclease of restriction endonuclease-like (RecB) superfamily
MTATYWEIGRRIVEHEQRGQKRAEYGEALLEELSRDLTRRFGRGFGVIQLRTMRQFYATHPLIDKTQSVIGQFPIRQSVIDESQKSLAVVPIRQSVIDELSPRRSRAGQSSVLENLKRVGCAFPLPWTHYVRLLRVRNALAREFYAREALVGGSSVRQLDRQINSQFYERSALSKNKSAMLLKGEKPKPGDAVSADEEIRNPLVLEFLNLKDEYSENELEESLIQHLETFLLELGDDFAFVARQRRLRIGNEWFRVDLLFFHRRLRCLVIIDLKIGGLVHADVGQMHVYCNYAREHWMRRDEHPPVGLILCTDKDDALARYAMEGLGSKLLIREYMTALPKESTLAAELARTREILERRSRERPARV